MTATSVIVALVAVLQVAAARTDATVAGRVRDAETGRPLPGATVAAADVGQTAVTDADGKYTLARLPAGPQHISVRLMGHDPYTLHAVVPRQGTLELNLTLRAHASRLAHVQVRGSRERSDVARVAIDRGDGRAVRGIALTRHPQLSEPDFLRALVGGDVVAAPETPGGLHLRGGAADQTVYAVDGVPVFNPYHVSDLMGGWNVDAFESARLLTDAASSSGLSGEVQLTSRSPDRQLSTRGAFSSTHARLTVDGPLGVGQSGFLLSGRRAFPAILAPEDDPTFVRGRSGDWMGKVEIPLRHGILRAFVLHSADGVNLSSAPPADGDSAPTLSRNTFRWTSSSSALQWRGRRGRDSVELSGWSSGSNVVGSWSQRPLALASRRTDRGLHLTLSRRTPSANTRTGLRLVHSGTTYLVNAGSRAAVDLTSTSHQLTAFFESERKLTGALSLDVGTSAVLFDRRVFVSPRVRGQWAISERLSLSGTVLRSHQFAQSMRNTESAAGYVFPVDLFVGAQRDVLPVARNDELSAAADFAPLRFLRTRLVGYRRRMDGIVLVAPTEDAPFLRGAPSSGQVHARGAYAEAQLNVERVALLARYGVQRVQNFHANGSYVPGFAARSMVDGGVSVFPTATTTLRLGITAAMGRQVTPASGSVEWESCNLKDRGCEFAGSPRADPTLVGQLKAPDYVRVDFGVRQHVHVRVASRTTEVALFGTVSNVLNRFNVLTYSLTGDAIQPLEMRPRAPLVVGLDWRF